MDSSASDSTKEVACATYFSKFSEKKEKKKMIITLVNILLHICFITFLMCKNPKESQTQCLLISSKQS